MDLTRTSQATDNKYSGMVPGLCSPRFPPRRRMTAGRSQASGSTVGMEQKTQGNKARENNVKLVIMVTSETPKLELGDTGRKWRKT